jgi:hypothetical protein
MTALGDALGDALGIALDGYADCSTSRLALSSGRPVRAAHGPREGFNSPESVDT